jgi:acetyl-CoA acetyltransferase family protein
MTERSVNGGSLMTEAYLCDAVRTPIGRYGGALSAVRADDLAAAPLRALMERNAGVDWEAVDDLIYGCANQAGEDNRNVARMAALLAGLPISVPGTTVNRLCGSGMDAVGMAARAIKAGDCDLMIAGGVESMSRAPFVMPKAETAFSRSNAVYDTTIGWRFVNPKMKAAHGIDSMPQTADNVAAEYGVSREDQDAFALRSQQDAGPRRRRRGASPTRSRRSPSRSARAIRRSSTPTNTPAPRPRPRRWRSCAASTGPDLSVTAGNASGVNDGAAALIVASEEAAKAQGLTRAPASSAWPPPGSSRG